MSSLLAPTSHLLLPLSLLLLFTVLFTAAEEHMVGSTDGWNTGVNYLTWSEQKSFTAGDDLVFSYVKGQHNVIEVTEATYRSCDSSTGTIKTYESGNDRIKLSNETVYYFICNINGHCLGGMKLRVRVKSSAGYGGGGAGNVPSRMPAVDSDAEPRTEGNGVAGGMGWWWTRDGCALMMLLCLLHLLRF